MSQVCGQLFFEEQVKEAVEKLRRGAEIFTSSWAGKQNFQFDGKTHPSLSSKMQHYTKMEEL